MVMLPASIATFRKAIRELRSGGMVATGIDRPIPHPKYRPLFFSRPASLPVHYVNLALDGRAPLVFVTAIQQPDGRYKMCTSDEIWMKQFQDRDKELLYNAEHVLETAADYIRQAPDQWNILQPVWPDALSAMP
jgi:lauroyl/myristoyl acyltransferase